MQKRWNPRIHAAQATAHNRFCIVLTELEFDDQFSAIIEYDGTLRQPWARTDVSREIRAVIDLKRSSVFDSHYAALSSEGNLYVLNKETTTDKIPGAGLLSQDSFGIGSLTELARFGDTLWAVGQSGEVYRKIGGNDWQKVAFNLTPPEGFQRPDLGPFDGASNEDAYVCGVLDPIRVTIDGDVEKRLVETNASNAEWKAAFAEAKKRLPNLPTSDEGRIYHWNGAEFEEIRAPVDAEVLFRSVFVEATDRVWIGGTEGTLLMGNARDGFRRAGRFSEDQHFVSLTKFRDTYVLASEDMIFGFNGSKLVRLDLPFDHTSLRPMKVQAVEDVLFYFDYQSGVYRFDGSDWKEIKIPRSLYERSFKGLR